MSDELELSELISEDVIKTRLRQLAQEITADFAGESVLLAGVLKGSFIFLADIAREINLSVDIGFMAVSSYRDGSVSAGVISVLYDLDRPVEGRNVVLVEDIADSGVTLDFLISSIRARNPKSLKVCVLLDKPSRRRVELVPDYIGFSIPDEFVVGYGLDYANHYRNLKGIYKCKTVKDI
jgi:hypoxanthine phosphoribosyltransferase